MLNSHITPRPGSFLNVNPLYTECNSEIVEGKVRKQLSKFISGEYDPQAKRNKAVEDLVEYLGEVAALVCIFISYIRLSSSL